MAGELKTDLISENTAAAGVTIDGVLIKDTTISALLPVTVYTADGAITISAGVHVISKTSAAAMTLAAPTAAQNGMTLVITNGTDFAHVITATGLLEDGTEGAHNIATHGAFIGASTTLVAYNLLWHVTATVTSTISAS